jgi:hypothetical protein
MTSIIFPLFCLISLILKALKNNLSLIWLIKFLTLIPGVKKGIKYHLVMR